MRRLAGYPGLLVAAVAVAMSVYHVYARVAMPPEAMILRALTLLFSLTLVFLLYPTFQRPGEGKVAWHDLGLAFLSLIAVGYIFVNYEYIATRYPTAYPLGQWDMFWAAVTTLLVLEATRRAIGLSLPITAVGFVVYALAGPYMPGFLRHRGITLEILLDQTYFTTEGIFGLPLSVAGTYVILFILFGAFLEKSGAGQFFMNFANAIAGGAKGGPGKVSVVSSSLFGTISGSAVANVMVDGWLTIPLMMRTGFRPPSAAAIEAVASTGGQIMPPIMGAAAFVMAEFLGVSYFKVALAAAIPAILYYAALFASIHFEALKTGLLGIPKSELPDLKKVLLVQGHLFLPVLVIIVLLEEGYTASYAAIIATALVIPLSWLRKATRMGLKPIIAALEDGAYNTLPVAMACACAGIIIGIVLQTGMAIRFTSFLVSLTGGSLIFILLITMVAAILLGMAMPTTPAYIIQAAILIPALIRVGVPPLAAHMFAFYFSCLSAVTPPVALAVYAAAGIARTGLWATGLQAVKFAAAGFIVPYFFVYSPALLFIGEPLEVARSAVTGTIGAIALAAGLMGYFLRPARWFERVVLVAGAIALIDPNPTTDVIGLVLLAMVALVQRVWRWKPAPVADRAASQR